MEKWTSKSKRNWALEVLNFPNIIYKEGTYATKVKKK